MTMKNSMYRRTAAGLLRMGCRRERSAVYSLLSCDRECLRGKVTQLLYALLKHERQRPARWPTRCA